MKYTYTIILLALLILCVLNSCSEFIHNRSNMTEYGNNAYPQYKNDAETKAFKDEYSDLRIEDAGKLYDLLVKAEHEGYVNPESGEPYGDYDFWMRTTADNSGSSAFGPIQLTKSYLDHVPMTAEGQPMISFDDEEQAFIDKFVSQGEQFLKWGGSDMPDDMKDESGNDVGHFDYGGKGYDWNDREKQLYRNVAEKYLKYEINRNDGDLDKTISAFRGADYEGDSEYHDIVKGGFKKDYSTSNI